MDRVIRGNPYGLYGFLSLSAAADGLGDLTGSRFVPILLRAGCGETSGRPMTFCYLVSQDVTSSFLGILPTHLTSPSMTTAGVPKT